MPGSRRSVGELIAMGVIAGLIAFGIAYGTRRTHLPDSAARAAESGNVLESPGARFELHPAAARVTMKSRDGAVTEEVDLALVVDGVAQPLALGRDDLRPVAGSVARPGRSAAAVDALRADVPVPIGDQTLDAQITFSVDPVRDALVIDLTSRDLPTPAASAPAPLPAPSVPVAPSPSTVPSTGAAPVASSSSAPTAGDAGAPSPLAAASGGGEPDHPPEHTVALRVGVANGGQLVFVAGVGQIADRASVSGGNVLVASSPHPVGVTSPSGPLSVDTMVDEGTAPGQPTHLWATSPPRPSTDATLGALRLALGVSSQTIWRALAELGGQTTGTVRGRVSGTSERAIVFGRDAQGLPQVRAMTGPGGSFQIDAPTTVIQWYAAIDAGRASALASFVPGTPHDLVLDVSPGGDLHVVVNDADTHRPLTARLLVRGIAGTVDPSFGPDYRASGAGPVIDALRGDVTTPLPSGRYRVAATKGIEWSVDAQVVEISPGRVTEVALAPRHVIPTPGVLDCDLHVHARPSFDTPVTPEDRVLSLVAAGIEFAVPTEHNLVGDYSSALETLDLRGELLSVPGVEVTTYSKGFGHFGVFPYPVNASPPPFKHTSMNAIFHAVRTGDPNRYFQLHHPRLPKGLGYFNNIGFDPKGPRAHIHNRIDFDGIEVYNGYDSEKPERVDQVLRDYWALLDFGWRYAATGSSDSHRIQFHWAGYPRTLVTVDPRATLENDRPPSDPLVVVANIKKGHATVTSGPIIELELGGASPGDETVTHDDPIHGHLRIRAAPWVDVTHVDVVVGQVGGSYRIAQSFEIPSRPTVLGPEAGTLEEAAERTIRFDRDLDVTIGSENGWVQVVVRGARPMDDVLPFMPVPPYGFTNPVYVVRTPAPPPPFPALFGAAPPARAP